MVFGLSKKERKRITLEENKRKGRLAEDEYKINATMRGVEYERSPHGKDFIERKRDFVTRKVTKTTHVEVKSSPTAPMSELQKKTKKEKSNYRVHRTRY